MVIVCTGLYRTFTQTERDFRTPCGELPNRFYCCSVIGHRPHSAGGRKKICDEKGLSIVLTHTNRAYDYGP
jgi:hypothetical protein